MSRWSAANPINRHICRRICKRRNDIQISRKALAEVLNISTQQVEKYDRGKGNISAAKLWIIARELGVPVSWFYEGL